MNLSPQNSSTKTTFSKKPLRVWTFRVFVKNWWRSTSTGTPLSSPDLQSFTRIDRKRIKTVSTICIPNEFHQFYLQFPINKVLLVVRWNFNPLQKKTIVKMGIFSPILRVENKDLWNHRGGHSWDSPYSRHTPRRIRSTNPKRTNPTPPRCPAFSPFARLNEQHWPLRVTLSEQRWKRWIERDSLNKFLFYSRGNNETEKNHEPQQELRISFMGNVIRSNVELTITITSFRHASTNFSCPLWRKQESFPASQPPKRPQSENVQRLSRHCASQAQTGQQGGGRCWFGDPISSNKCGTLDMWSCESN